MININTQISRLGFGAGEIGDALLNDKDVSKLLETAFENGINFYDTARSYGYSERRLSGFIKDKRDKVFISTKGGYGVDGTADWTYDAVYKGIEEALEKLKTDYIDLFFLHSCPVEILLAGEVIAALGKARQEGKILYAGYSGDNEPLQTAVFSGEFDFVQTSINICDQQSLIYSLPMAESKGIKMIAKRTLANIPWRFTDRPEGHYAEVYWERLQKLKLNYNIPLDELFLRFTVFEKGVTSALTGTTSIKNLKRNIESFQKGPLANEIIADIKRQFIIEGSGWRSEI